MFFKWLSLYLSFSYWLTWTTKEAHPPKSFDPSELTTHAEIKNRCGPHAAAQKRNQWALHRRELSVDANDRETTYQIHASAPAYDFIKNWTNILTPETSHGPYFYPQSQTLRQDIREGQPGVPLSLEIGVVDINICEPIEDVLVDIWVSRLCYMIGSKDS
jgi:hypothetical protein